MRLIVQRNVADGGRAQRHRAAPRADRSVRSTASPSRSAGGITNRNFRVTLGGERLRDPPAGQGHRPAGHRPRGRAAGERGGRRASASRPASPRRSRTAWSPASSPAQPLSAPESGRGASRRSRARCGASTTRARDAADALLGSRPARRATRAIVRERGGTLPAAYARHRRRRGADRRRAAARRAAPVPQRPARRQHHPRARRWRAC